MAKSSAEDERGDTPPLLMYAVKQVELAVRARLDDLLKPHGVTALQYTALTVLEHGGELSAAQLARNSFVTAQSMADMVRALTGKGLITRTRDESDRKRLLISLTPAGLQFLADVRHDVQELDLRMTGSLTSRQRESLRSSLNECRAALQQL
ncbi:MAG: MarR family transcriptional regulator [Nocardioides sp.]